MACRGIFQAIDDDVRYRDRSVTRRDSYSDKERVSEVRRAYSGCVNDSLFSPA